MYNAIIDFMAIHCQYMVDMRGAQIIVQFNIKTIIVGKIINTKYQYRLGQKDLNFFDIQKNSIASRETVDPCAN